MHTLLINCHQLIPFVSYRSNLTNMAYLVAVVCFSRSHDAPPPIIWMDERSIFTSTVLGYPLGTPGPFKYIYNLTRIFNFDATFVTSQIMVSFVQPKTPSFWVDRPID